MVLYYSFKENTAILVWVVRMSVSHSVLFICTNNTLTHFIMSRRTSSIFSLHQQLLLSTKIINCVVGPFLLTCRNTPEPYTTATSAYIDTTIEEYIIVQHALTAMYNASCIYCIFAIKIVYQFDQTELFNLPIFVSLRYVKNSLFISLRQTIQYTIQCIIQRATIHQQQ